MDLQVLGPLEVVEGDGSIALPSSKQRRLLAALIVNRGTVVSVDGLVDAVWGEAPPASARKLLQIYVSQLRKALPDDAEIVTRPGGYTLRLQDDRLDAARFERLLAEGRDALRDGNEALALSLISRALSFWRGPAYADVAYDDFARAEAIRLEELRLVALEEQMEARLRLGRHAEIVGELSALAQEHPLRERLHVQLMLALYRCGRQSESLEVFASTRTRLGEELGLDPGTELRDLHQRVLRQDPLLDAPSSDTAVPSPLPQPPNELIGRDRELEELERILSTDAVRLVTLTGAGGSGKTRLALEVARIRAHRYANGAAFVELAPLRDPELIVDTIARALDVREVAGRTLLETLSSRLRTREMLLVVDNAEHVRSATTAFVELLARAPRVTILVTSRAVLHLTGEHVFPVAPLEESSAVDLFERRAREADPAFAVTTESAADVQAICARVDRLPLAIELAAARVRALTPARLLGRLSSMLSVLTGGPRDLPARQQTLRETIDWSVGLLGDDERRVLARLAVFQGGATLEAAETVCRTDLDTLGTLVDDSLVRRDIVSGEPRFALLETIREYALELLGPGRTEARASHAAFMRTLVENAKLQGAEQTRWLPVLDLEIDNIRAALDLAVEDGDSTTELGMVAVLWRYWWIRGHLAEGRARLDGALRRAGGEDEGSRQRVLYGAAGLAWSTGDYTRAASFAATLLDAARASGSIAEEASAHNILGSIALHERRLAEAEEHYRRSVSLAESASKPIDVVTAKLNLAEVMLANRDGASAAPILEEVLAYHRKEDIVEGIGFACLNLGHASYLLGDDAAAGERFAEARDAFEQIGFRAHRAHALQGIAAVAAKAGRFEEAASALGHADGELADVGVTPGDFDTAFADEVRARGLRALGEENFTAAYSAGRTGSL